MCTSHGGKWGQFIYSSFLHQQNHMDQLKIPLPLVMVRWWKRYLIRNFHFYLLVIRVMYYIKSIQFGKNYIHELYEILSTDLLCES